MKINIIKKKKKNINNNKIKKPKIFIINNKLEKYMH